MTDPRVAARPVVRWPGTEPESDWVVVEEPLEIRVEDRSIAVTMRTPGDDLDLAAGFLLTEGIVEDAGDLAALAATAENVVTARLHGGVEAHVDAISTATRELYATSACGICGKASLDRVHLLAPPLRARVDPDPDVLRALPGRLVQPAFERTGGLHAAGLFAFDGTPEVIREDIGRHNAVDKVIGWRLRRDRVPIDDRILLVSGRAGFEVVQKARMAGIPVVAAVGAASALAIDLARDAGMALVGFLRADRYTRYT